MLWNDLRTRTNRLDFGIDPDMTQDQFFHFSALTNMIRPTQKVVGECS